jgi:diguanylate cyclase (GGDEF)-like protein
VAVLAPWHLRLLDRLFIASFVLVIVLVVPVLWRAWHQRSRYLWLFGLAWAAPIICGGARITANLGLLPWSFWLDQSTILSMAVEALLSSGAIAYRVRLLSVERDQAREQEVAARMLANTDPLTGLLNRRAFLDRAIGRTGEQTLVLIDIDHFKRVNETIGHDGGDDVLRALADTLRASLPSEAMLARLGGEEFAAVFAADLAVAPDDILYHLRAARMPFDLAVTASIGACSGSLASEVEWKALYRCADRALFEAKAAGRDRARTADRHATDTTSRLRPERPQSIVAAGHQGG